MCKDCIKEKVVDILSKIFYYKSVDKDLIEYVDLIDDLEIDSISFISMLVEIESAFGITIPDDFLLVNYFSTVEDIVNLVKSMLEAKEQTMEECNGEN